MNHTSKLSLALETALACLVMAGVAQAQSMSSSSSGRSSSMFTPGFAYLGMNFGQSSRLNSGTGGFASQQRKNSHNIYGGAYFNENFGAQIGFTDFDPINRAGGTTYANGVTLSLVGRLPVAPSFNLLGRVGTTYSRTKVSSNPASGIPQATKAVGVRLMA